jgi:uncharacterized protein YjbJ (UPF0337 family)
MSTAKKTAHTGEKIKGKAKEAAGHVTGDQRKVAAGRVQQSKADAKQAGQHTKDALKR